MMRGMRLRNVLNPRIVFSDQSAIEQIRAQPFMLSAWRNANA